MLGDGEQKTAVDRRAKRLTRMVAVIVRGLETKSYEQFIASFSDPGSEPNTSDRSSRDHRFQIRISPTCWYDAFASFPTGKSPSVLIQGGGYDFGVFIAADTQSPATADLHVALGQRAGRDAEAMVRSLRATHGFTSYVENKLFGIRKA